MCFIYLPSTWGMCNRLIMLSAFILILIWILNSRLALPSTSLGYLECNIKSLKDRELITAWSHSGSRSKKKPPRICYSKQGSLSELIIAQPKGRNEGYGWSDLLIMLWKITNYQEVQQLLKPNWSRLETTYI